MYTSHHRYPINRIQVPAEMAMYFARGSQERVDSRVNTKEKVVYKKPKTAWDHVKMAITTWNPRLLFGWLVPELEDIKETIGYQKDVYYNVIPSVKPERGRAEVIFNRMIPGKPYQTELDPMGWLESEPATQDEVDQIVRNYIETEIALSKEESGFYMAAQRFSDG